MNIQVFLMKLGSPSPTSDHITPVSHNSRIPEPTLLAWWVESFLLPSSLSVSAAFTIFCLSICCAASFSYSTSTDTSGVFHLPTCQLLPLPCLEGTTKSAHLGAVYFLCCLHTVQLWQRACTASAWFPVWALPVNDFWLLVHSTCAFILCADWVSSGGLGYLRSYWWGFLRAHGDTHFLFFLEPWLRLFPTVILIHNTNSARASYCHSGVPVTSYWIFAASRWLWTLCT